LHAPDDARNLLASEEVIIPNAVPDSPAAQNMERRSDWETPTLLFVATLRESKGVGVLLEAAHLLRQRQLTFRLKLVGSFESLEYETAVRRDIERLNLGDVVEMPGVLLGRSFEHAYQDADIFCFPSFYDSEAIPLVVVEAMRFGLPVVASRWRGIVDVVDDGVSGVLVPIKDPIALANAISGLLQNPTTAVEMGRRGRQLYRETYTVETFHIRMSEAFATAAGGVM
jgi:glycosyltransferase involved in cell wall biosynthesis